MQIPFASTLEVLGTVAFTVSGTYSAMQKRLDLFGVLTTAFSTAIGGGTIRDLLIGNTPVVWMRDPTVLLIIAITCVLTIFLKRWVLTFKTTLFLFDAVGLGVFTIIGMQKGIELGLNPVVCIALGTITGCFGGVLRDILLNQIPDLFHKEIYATACIVGGVVYYGLRSFAAEPLAESMAILVVFGVRYLAVTFNWKLPVG